MGMSGICGMTCRYVFYLHINTKSSLHIMYVYQCVYVEKCMWMHAWVCVCIWLLQWETFLNWLKKLQVGAWDSKCFKPVRKCNWNIFWPKSKAVLTYISICTLFRHQRYHSKLSKKTKHIFFFMKRTKMSLTLQAL